MFSREELRLRESVGRVQAGNLWACKAEGLVGAGGQQSALPSSPQYPYSLAGWDLGGSQQGLVLGKRELWILAQPRGLPPTFSSALSTAG